jgi:hypothetical protein
MVQAQLFQGYFRNGQFVSPQGGQLPENVEVFITVTGREIAPKTDKLTPEQLDVAKNFLYDVERISNEGFSDEAKESFEMWDKGEFRLKFEERLS